MARLYQISLRSIMEIIFVAAVILAFMYWRNVPRLPSARYQVHQTEKGGLLYVDTVTGEVWASDRNSSETGYFRRLKAPWDKK